ncbi:MAG: hypothetical protein JWQ94_1829 [Tardiphaga sp.]|jgi:hypothetical protein|nr:hypothetical protein [Tardiphaga sp.]
MMRSNILNLSCSVVLALSFVATSRAQTPAPAAAPASPVAPKPMQLGGVLSGKLNALRVRAPKGKRVNTFQLVSEPRRLPAPAGLCNLETGPETFEIVAANDAQTKLLQKLINKDVSLKVTEVACAEQAGQMSEALVTKWSVVTTPN